MGTAAETRSGVGRRMTGEEEKEGEGEEISTRAAQPSGFRGEIQQLDTHSRKRNAAAAHHVLLISRNAGRLHQGIELPLLAEHLRPERSRRNRNTRVGDLDE
ncbi:hypothetical protein Droror1_Dr00012206 [Drosera rotundifolia]